MSTFNGLKLRGKVILEEPPLCGGPLQWVLIGPAVLSLPMQVGSEYTFTIRDPSTISGIAFGVSYDAFIDDVQVGGHSTEPQHMARSHSISILSVPIMAWYMPMHLFDSIPQSLNPVTWSGGGSWLAF